MRGVVEGERKNLVVAKRCINLAQNVLKMSLDICRGIYARIGFHGIKIEILLQPILNFGAETGADFLFPRHFLRLIVAGVHRENKQKIDIVMKQQERVAVEKAVAELFAAVMVSCAVGALESVVGIVERIKDHCRNKEIGDYGVTLSEVVAEFYARLVRNVVVVENVEIPLYDVPRVGVLLVDGFAAEVVPLLVIFAVADVISLGDVAVNQAFGGENMVNHLAVLLLFFDAVGRWIVANELVDDGLKDDVEILGEEVFALFGADEYLPALVQKSIAQVPHFQRLVGKILVLDLP